jgi:hypothetical protein
MSIAPHPQDTPHTAHGPLPDPRLSFLCLVLACKKLLQQDLIRLTADLIEAQRRQAEAEARLTQLEQQLSAGRRWFATRAQRPAQ